MDTLSIRSQCDVTTERKRVQLLVSNVTRQFSRPMRGNLNSVTTDLRIAIRYIRDSACVANVKLCSPAASETKTRINWLFFSGYFGNI
jgi:hypothetical protein